MNYRIFYHNVKDSGKEFVSAGIAALGDNGEILKQVFDVSTDLAAVENLVNSLNENNIELIQLNDILEDFYSGHY